MPRRHLPAFVACTLLVSFTTSTASAQIQTLDAQPMAHAPSFLGYVTDEIIVVLKSEAAGLVQGRRTSLLDGIDAFDSLQDDLDVVSSVRQFAHRARLAPNADAATRRLSRHVKVRFRTELEAAIAAFAAHPLVEDVEPIGVHAVHATPNDTYFDNPPPAFPYPQWHLWDNHGVDADLAWDDEAGDPDVVVAVLDTGVRYFHTDLGGPNPPWGPDAPATNGNIWVNAGEIPNNGIDDDGNGYVDDTVGYDFVADTSDPLWVCADADCGTADNDPHDGEGHGTHVAGTVSAITNNAAGVAGVAGGFSDGTSSGAGNGARIMSLRVGWRAAFLFTLTGVVRMDYAAEAMDYVTWMKTNGGVNVAAINCSWGSSDSGGLNAAVDALLAADVMIVKAAGNSNSSTPDFLGGKAGVTNVGATGPTGAGSSFSNFGNWVDVAAPGEQVVSTYHNPADPTVDYVTLLDGTSMAAPHVCGIAALLESFDSTLTATDKHTIIVNTALPYSGTKDVGSGIANARAALDAVGPPCDVTAEFTADSVSGCGSLIVNFTDLSSGPVTTWAWDFGDGNASNVQHPSHQYTTPGQYTVTLSTTSATCVDAEAKIAYINVLDTPVAQFSAAPVNGSAPMNVNFSDLSSGNPDTWSWEFGDGAVSSLQNPSHTYTTAGTYTVSLTVTNSCGSEVETKTDFIQVNPPTGGTALAESDLPSEGTVSGDYLLTHVSDDVLQSITEVTSNGNPARRRSSAGHRWTFTVTPAASVEFFVEAHRTDNAEGDDFVFEWSTDNSTFQPLLTIDSSVPNLTRTAPLPAGTQGTVYIRAIDGDNSQGNSSLDTLFVDAMSIVSSGSVNNAPTVTISAPADGTSVPSGSVVDFTGTATDTEDGDLTAALAWSSDIQGALGSGGSPSAALVDGVHTITATVTDSGAKTGSDAIVITVGSTPMLQVTVLTDKPSYVHGEIVLISVIVTDGTVGVAGATVNVTLTTAKNKQQTASDTTDLFGTSLFTHTVNARKEGRGTYLLEVEASAPGYLDGSGSTTFEVQ